MTVGRAFRKLTRLVRRLERSDWTVVAVEPISGPAFEAEEPLTATIRCRRTGAPGEGSPSAGRTRLQGAPPDVVAEVRDLSSDVVVSPDEVRVEADGTTILELVVEVRLNGSDPSTNGASTEPEAANGESDTPLHRDRNLLWRLYNEYDTFGDMADAVDRTVSEETIRRYMIEHGIHDPNAETNGHRPRTNGHGPMDEGERGVRLPPSVDEDALVEAVVSSKTVREVSNRLDLDRDTTVEILSELEVLEHVMGPLRDAPDRAITEAEIRERLARADPTPT